MREFDSKAPMKENGPLSDLAIDLAPEALRAYDAIVRPNAILPIPRYFIEHWLPLLGASRAWLALAYRQVAFISHASSAEVSIHTTLRRLGHWCGLSHVRIHQVLKEPGYLSWFVRNPAGDLSLRNSPRSQPTTYMVRSDIPLSPPDQARLSLYFEGQSPSDDQEWIQALEGAIDAKKIDLPEHLTFPQISLTIQQMVYAQRGMDTPLPPGLDQACTELHARWIQPDRVTLATHYFLVRWLPELSPGLGWLIMLLRSRAYHQKDEFVGQVWINGGWKRIANSLGVSRRSLTRWVSSSQSNLFFQHRSDALDPTNHRNLLLAIRLSEPIHPSDQDEYQLKLEGQSLTSPIPLDRQSLTSPPPSPGQSLTSCGDLSTDQSKDLTSDSHYLPTRTQNLTSKVPSFNKDETKLNTLSDSLILTSQEYIQDNNLQLYHFTENKTQDVVVLKSQWQIDELLSHAGMGKKMRTEILAASLNTQMSFIAWILFAITIPTIQYPVLFAYKRSQETLAPNLFLQLAQMSVEELYKWLVENTEEKIPAQLQKIVKELKKHRAHEKLLNMGAIDRSLDDLVASEYEVNDPLKETKKRYTPPVAIHIEGMNAEKAWVAAKGQLQAEIDKVAYDTWVKDVEYVDFENGAIKLGVANDYAKNWLEDRLTKIAERVLSGIIGERVTVTFVIIFDEQ